LIFNFTSAKNCPAKLNGNCKIPKMCYARKAEYMYKNCIPYRNRQEMYFDECDIIDFVNRVSTMVNNKHRTIKIKYLRFSEAGDFKNQKVLDKFAKCCKQLKKSVPQLIIYGYSAQNNLDFSELRKYATINGQFNRISNKVIIINNIKDIPKEAKFICNGDCHNCTYCKESKGRNIYFVKH